MSEQSDAAPESSSLLSRGVKVFVAPGELFDELRERPVWLGALLVVVAASLLYNVLLPDEIMRQAMMEGAQARGGEEMGPDQLEQMQTIATWTRYIGSVVGPFLVAAVVAGFMMFTFNLVLGGQASFRQLMSVSSHALIITAVGGLVTLPLVISSGDMTTVLSLHLLVPGLEEGGYLHTFLRGLNVFSLGAAAVLGVGASRLYRRETGNSVAIMVGAYVAVSAVTAVFGGLMPGG